MKAEVITDIAQSYVSRLYEENEYPNSKRDIEIDVEGAFIDGANWRINSVWHDTDDRSIKIDNDKQVVLLLENGKLIEYDDDWEQYCCIAVKWAYKENLLPNK